MTIDPAPERLRILILSTPKTGNTWLMNLLSAMYDLPKVGLVCPFQFEQASQLGERWITFHHLMPEPELLRWIEEAQPYVITTIRHPGDVLISLYHHIYRFPSEPVELSTIRKMLVEPFERVNIEPPAIHSFHDELECSIAWIRSGITRVVRYENLRCDTFQTLMDLSSWINPVSEERVEQAIAKCDFHLMRSLAGVHKAFFRSGAVGEWRTLLPPEILQIFEAEPYARQFEELGYSLDDRSESRIPLNDRPGRNPFGSLQLFDNGVPVAPIVVDFFLSLDPQQNRKWPPVSNSGSGSFLQWCNGSSELAGLGHYSGVPLSRLAHYIYRIRPDLQNAFPDLTGEGRIGYAEWFIREHNTDYGLDAYFAAVTRSSLSEWGHGSSELAGTGFYAGVPLTKFAHQVYRVRPDLQETFPDLTGADRAGYAEWFIRAHDAEHGIEQAIAALTKRRFLEWGNARHPLDRERRPWWPKLTNFAMHVYGTRKELRSEFADVWVQDRWNLLYWLVNADHGLQIFPELAQPIKSDLNRLRVLRRLGSLLKPRT